MPSKGHRWFNVANKLARDNSQDAGRFCCHWNLFWSRPSPDFRRSFEKCGRRNAKAGTTGKHIVLVSVPAVFRCLGPCFVRGYSFFKAFVVDLEFFLGVHLRSQPCGMALCVWGLSSRCTPHLENGRIDQTCNIGYNIPAPAGLSRSRAGHLFSH